MVAHQQCQKVRVAALEAWLTDEHMRLRRGKGNVLLHRCSQRLHFRHFRQRIALCWRRQAGQQRAHQRLRLRTADGTNDGHPRTAGLQVARAKLRHVLHADGGQGGFGHQVAVGMGAIHRSGKGFARNSAGAGARFTDGSAPAGTFALPDGCGQRWLCKLAGRQVHRLVQQRRLGQRAQRKAQAVVAGACVQAGAQVGPGFAQGVFVQRRFAALGTHAFRDHGGHRAGQARLRSRVAPAASVKVHLHIHHRDAGALNQPDARAIGFGPMLNGQQCPGRMGIKNGSSAYQ